MKISEDPEKSTVPGRKAVYRLVDTEGKNECEVPQCLSVIYCYFSFFLAAIQESRLYVNSGCN